MATNVAAETLGGRKVGLHTALWIVQIALALAFGMAGFMKATTPMAALGEKIVWAKDVPAPLVRFIGISEVSAMLGLLLPASTRVRPILTAWAATGLVVVMVLATGFHLMRGEAQFIPMTLTFAVMAAFVAWGRFVGRPITPR